MKKIFAALLAAVLLFSCASAENTAPASPASDLNGSMTLTIDGTTVVMDYDSDPEYSNLMNGSVQASFYTETDDGLMYEAYILFPETVQTGDVVTTQSSIQAGQSDPGAMLYVTGGTQDICAAAFQFASAAYPAGSQYSIRFDTVSPSGSLCSYTGSLTATLMVVDKLYNPLYPLEVSGTFDFTFDKNNKYTPKLPAQPEATPAPAAPEATPTPTLPGQHETTPAPEAPGATPFVPQMPAAPKNTPSLITPADAKKI